MTFSHSPKRLLISALTSALLVACGSTSSDQTSSADADSNELSMCDKVFAGYAIQVPDGEFEVCKNEVEYVAATGTLNQIPNTTATLGLSSYGIGVTESAISLNHPASGASDGKNLVVADRFNNRILVFNGLPTGTTEPNIVVGQPNFTDITPGNGLADLNWPGAVEMTPQGSLIIADTENGRLLIYKSLPTTNGAPADFALDLAALTGNDDSWPWGIWSDGNSLVVTDTRRGNILVWDTFPSDENSKPTTSSNPNVVGTPRNISSDGKSFLIGDENGSAKNCWGEEKVNKNRQSHIWINRLPIGEPDGCVWDWYQGDSINGGLIALSAGGKDAVYWPSFPINSQTALEKTSTGIAQGVPNGQPVQPGDPVQPGQPVQPGDPVQPGQPVQPGEPVQPAAKSASKKQLIDSQSSGHEYLGGDGGDVVVTNSVIYFIEYNGNRVTAWNELPEDIQGKTPDFSIFDSNPDISTILRDGFIQNPVLVNANGALVASSDYDRRVHVWNSAPGQNSARADYVYLTGFPAWDNTFANNTLMIAGRDSVAIWNNFAPGNLPDRIIKGTIGSVPIVDIKGIAYDGTYLAIADGQSDLVSVFEGIPTDGQEPLRSYNVRGPGRLDMEDGILVIAPKEGSEVLSVDLKTSSNPSKLNVSVNLPSQGKFLPFGFAIADTSFHRVQIWNSLEDAKAGKDPAAIIGGEKGERPQTSADRFYFPASLEVIGKYLYVGEFKFSNRILGFTSN